jgi:hypothetical protein
MILAFFAHFLKPVANSFHPKNTLRAHSTHTQITQQIADTNTTNT